METIKCTIYDAVVLTHGACTLNLTNEDLCISICVHAYPEYVIYIRPDDMQTHFLCQYAHREDLEGCANVSAEMEAWKQQAVLQLPRKVQGRLGQFVKVACDYVDAAVARMELRRGLNGRGAYVKVKTFEEAKQEAVLNPRPKRAKAVLPPPVCRRHMGVHWEAEKRHKKLEEVQKLRGEREGRELKARVWVKNYDSGVRP